MTLKSTVESFLSEKTLAVAGVSRQGKKFGNPVFDDLKKKGYTVYPINPNAEKIKDDTCYPGPAALPKGVGGLVIVAPPAQTESLVKEAFSAGIKKIWIQQGAESEAALRFCRDSNIETVSKECILMFVEPVDSIHKFHRFIWKIFGKLPK